jgi:hypothetical protein
MMLTGGDEKVVLLIGGNMNSWLLREIDDLQSRIDRMGSPRELSDEIRAIREEADLIAGASFADGPMPPLFVGVDALKERVNQLKEKLDPFNLSKTKMAR